MAHLGRSLNVAQAQLLSVVSLSRVQEVLFFGGVRQVDVRETEPREATGSAEWSTEPAASRHLPGLSPASVSVSPSPGVQ